MQCLGIDCATIHGVHMYVQHKGRVQQAKLLNFLNSFYFSAFRFYFTRVLDPHPNTTCLEKARKLLEQLFYLCR